MISATPVLRLNLPTDSRALSVRVLDEAGLKTFAGALFEGKLRRALQSTSGSADRAFGLTMKVFRRDGSGSVECEHSFRVATQTHRDQLVQILGDPARASLPASLARSQLPHAALAALPPASALRPVQPSWSCERCPVTNTMCIYRS